MFPLFRSVVAVPFLVALTACNSPNDKATPTTAAAHMTASPAPSAPTPPISAPTPTPAPSRPITAFLLTDVTFGPRFARELATPGPGVLRIQRRDGALALDCIDRHALLAGARMPSATRELTCDATGAQCTVSGPGGRGTLVYRALGGQATPWAFLPGHPIDRPLPPDVPAVLAMRERKCAVLDALVTRPDAFFGVTYARPFVVADSGNEDGYTINIDCVSGHVLSQFLAKVRARVPFEGMVCEEEWCVRGGSGGNSTTALHARREAGQPVLDAFVDETMSIDFVERLAQAGVCDAAHATDADACTIDRALAAEATAAYRAIEASITQGRDGPYADGFELPIQCAAGLDANLNGLTREQLLERADEVPRLQVVESAPACAQGDRVLLVDRGVALDDRDAETFEYLVTLVRAQGRWRVRERDDLRHPLCETVAHVAVPPASARFARCARAFVRAVQAIVSTYDGDDPVTRPAGEQFLRCSGAPAVTP